MLRLVDSQTFCLAISQMKWKIVHDESLEYLNNESQNITVETVEKDEDSFPALPTSDAVAPKQSTVWTPASYTKAAKKKPDILDSKQKFLKQQAQKVEGRSNTVKVDMPWLATGDAVAATYAQYRREAFDNAQERNILFQKAAEAYISGNKAAAKALALAWHKINSQVEQLHQQASQRIFWSKNTFSSSQGQTTIDLHGLHPLEAVDLVGQALEKCKVDMIRGRIVIITGTGHHSNSKAQVLPAVKNALVHRGYRPKAGTLRDGKGGILGVDL